MFLVIWKKDLNVILAFLDTELEMRENGDGTSSSQEDAGIIRKTMEHLNDISPFQD